MRRKKRVRKACSYCGRILNLMPSQVREKNKIGWFCSSECRAMWQSENRKGDQHPRWKGGLTETKCPVCGKIFEAKPSVLNRTPVNCCSPKCSGIWKSLPHSELVTCVVCGKTIRAKKSANRIYCSAKCRYEHMGEIQQGSNSHFWQGGTSFAPYPPEFNERYRRSIRERDGYICQMCGKPDSKSVHHVDYTKDNIEPSNLLTLCNSCHSATNSNREYWTKRLQEFMNHE